MLADPDITAEPVAGMQSGETGIRNPVPIAISTYPSQPRIIPGAWIPARETDFLRERGAAPKKNGIFRATDAIWHEAPFKPHKPAKLRAQLNRFGGRDPALAYAIVNLGLQLSTIGSILAPLSGGWCSQ
jgi:hypothetical protein